MLYYVFYIILQNYTLTKSVAAPQLLGELQETASANRARSRRLRLRWAHLNIKILSSSILQYSRAYQRP